MVVLWFLGIGVLLGLIGSLILREDGYAVVGEVVIGILGAVTLGMLATVQYGLDRVTAEVLIASLAGATLAEGAVVVLTPKARARRAAAANATRAYLAQSGLTELRAEGFRLVLIALVFPSIYLAALLVDTARVETWLVPVGLATVAALTYLALRLDLLPSAVILLSGLSLMLYGAVLIYPTYPLAPLYGLLVLIAGVLLGPTWGIAWAVISTVVVAAGVLVGHTISPEVGIVAELAIWGSAILGWLASLPVYTALDWSWSSYVQALRKTEELEDRQGELTRAVKGLSEAYYRLERANEELDRARRAADEARRLKAQFAASLSHELRTPLNLIVGFSETMLMAPHAYGAETLPPTYRGDVEAIYRNARHLSNLIDDVLDLSQIEAGRMGLSREPCQLDEVIAEAVSVVRKRFQARCLDLTMEVPADLPAVTIDRTRVRQVLINLLNNAARFTERGGARISATGGEREVVVAVSDTGVGIKAEDLPTVFQEFHQFDGGTGRPHDGSGLGLSISKRFVELHGGSIWVESVPGQGSTFCFTLPCSDRVVSVPMRQDWETWVKLQPTSEQGERRLAVVAEDQRSFGLFRRYLSGYQVAPAPGWAPAGVAASGEPPAAVVVCGSRAWLGSGVLKQAQGAYPALPVVTCSLTSVADAGRELGVAEYLVKPVARERLLEALRSLGRRIRSVVVIDDDPEVVELLARMLESARRRCRIYSATSGEEGLRLVAETRPDVVLLDLLMPGMDGYTVLAHMKADDALRDVPVIVITAKGYERELMVGNVVGVSHGEGLSVGQLMASVKLVLDGLVSPTDTSAPLPAGPAA